MELSVHAAMVIAVAIAAAEVFKPGEAYGVSSTVAIVPINGFPITGEGSVAVVCAILGGRKPRIARCSVITLNGGVVETFDAFRNQTFASLSTNHDSICGLSSDRKAFFCWRHAIRKDADVKGAGSFLIDTMRIHVPDGVELVDAIAGVGQVGATDINLTFVQWWHDGSDAPATFPGEFRSLTSGAGFFCAIRDLYIPICWGPGAQRIYPTFKGKLMNTIVAGVSHACGITFADSVLCGGNNDHGQSSPPPIYLTNKYGNIALGSTHTCAIPMPNYTIVCWGAGGGEYTPVPNGTQFISVVANGDLTCGIKYPELSVVCWWTSNRSSPSIIELPMGGKVEDDPLASL